MTPMSKERRRVVRLAIGGYALVGVAGTVLCAAANLEFDPSLEFGVGAAAAGLAYLLLGVNGWFLFTVREDLRLNQLNAQREACPYVRNESTDDEVFRPVNYGPGKARQVRAWRIRLRSAGDGLVADFAFSKIALCVQNDRTRANRWHVVGEPRAVDFDGAAPGQEYQHVICADELYREHARWFRLNDDSTLDELPGGVIQEGGLLAPPGAEDAAVTLSRELPEPS